MDGWEEPQETASKDRPSPELLRLEPPTASGSDEYRFQPPEDCRKQPKYERQVERVFEYPGQEYHFSRWEPRPDPSVELPWRIGDRAVAQLVAGKFQDLEMLVEMMKAPGLEGRYQIQCESQPEPFRPRGR
jgi:hypothetical protein